MAANDKKTQEWLDKALGKDIYAKIALLWTSGNPFCDSILQVVEKNGKVGGSFEVHKVILAMSSRKFATELYSTSPDEIPREIPFNFEVYDVPTSMMELLLEFMYTDAIERRTEWPEVGGLISIAKQYDIPRLLKYCTDKFERELGQRCEQVLDKFREFITLTKEQYKWDAKYYMEILKLCLAYILRNGDVILRSSNFRNKLSIENIEVFIGSDYLCVPSEVLVYRGLLKWARAQCRKQGLDPYDVECTKTVLRKPNQNKESLGLLKYVRFPVFTDDEFYSVVKSSDKMIPQEVEELVHRYHVAEEPTGLFSEERRPVDVDPEDEDFLEHVDELLCSLPAFATSPEDISENNSYLPCLEDDPLPNSTQSVNEKQSDIIINIKQEVDPDARTQSYAPNIPDHISVGTSTTLNSPWSSCPSTPARPTTSEKAKLKRTSNEAALTEAKNVSPIKLMKIKKEDKDEKTRDNICDKGENLSTGKTANTGEDRKKDVPVFKNQMIHKKKLTYSELIEDCSKNSYITSFVANHLEIDLKAKSKYQSVCMSRLRSFSVDATLDKKTGANLVKHLANINLEDFVFFYNDDSSPKNRLAQVWGKKINTTLKLSEVTVFHTNVGIDDSGKKPVGELTINYTRRSSFFLLNVLLNNMNILNLGNCKVNPKYWLRNEISEKLVELRLFRVKDIDLRAVLGQCKSLKGLCVWAAEHQTPSICLNDIVSKELRRLAVVDYVIKYDPDINNSAFPKCEELMLINHSCDPVFTEMIPKTFPNLQKLSVYNETYPPGPDFLLNITSESSLNEICLWNFEESPTDAGKVSKLKSLIKNYDLISKKNSAAESCSFQLKRKSPALWKGDNVKMDDLSLNIFQSFGLQCFYTFDAFKKIVWTKYV